jgi:D-sedoheptulose 7-phosphate isomerase
MKNIEVNKLLNNEIDSLQKTLQEIIKLKNFEILCAKCLKVVKKKKKIIFFGNGGSAADSQHLATELTVKYKRIRKAIAAVALSTDNSAITAIGNDYNFKFIFSRQLDAIGNQGDIAIALTTSGNSQNLIEAMKLAKKKKIITACFSGNKGGKIKKYVNCPIILKTKNTSVIQVIELLMGQVLCDYLEKNL